MPKDCAGKFGSALRFRTARSCSSSAGSAKNCQPSQAAGITASRSGCFTFGVAIVTSVRVPCTTYGNKNCRCRRLGQCRSSMRQCSSEWSAPAYTPRQWREQRSAAGAGGGSGSQQVCLPEAAPVTLLACRIARHAGFCARLTAAAVPHNHACRMTAPSTFRQLRF